MALYCILLFLGLQTVAGVHGTDASSGIRNDDREWADVLEFRNTERRTNAHLPKFSKKGKGMSPYYGSYYESYYESYSYYGQEWIWVSKSEKKYKDSKKDKKDKKDGKKDKKHKKVKYIWVPLIPTEMPTMKPIISSPPELSDAPTLSNDDGSGSGSGSGSEDLIPTSRSSEDCPRKYKALHEMTDEPELFACYINF